MFGDIEFLTIEEYENDVYEKKYGMNYGSSMLIITKEMIKALRKGLVVACNDGEYCTFIMIKREGK